MPAHFNVGFVLFYRPPCGIWYVHSHKIYSSEQEAVTKAGKFLPKGSIISVITVLGSQLDNAAEIV